MCVSKQIFSLIATLLPELCSRQAAVTVEQLYFCPNLACDQDHPEKQKAQHLTSMANHHRRCHAFPVGLIFANVHVWMAEWSNNEEVEVDRANDL